VHWRSRKSIPLLRFSLFWVVTQRRLLVTDLSAQLSGPILKGEAVQEEEEEDFFLQRQMPQ
jgi:hypothetical protein